MNRRGFLSLLAGGAAVLAADPEKAFWKPGAKMISVPAVKRIFTVGDIVTFDGVFEDRGSKLLRQFIICGEVESSHPLIYPQIMPSGPYQNVLAGPGWQHTNRPPIALATLQNPPRFTQPVPMAVWVNP